MSRNLTLISKKFEKSVKKGIFLQKEGREKLANRFFL